MADRGPAKRRLRRVRCGRRAGAHFIGAWIDEQMPWATSTSQGWRGARPKVCRPHPREPAGSAYDCWTVSCANITNEFAKAFYSERPLRCVSRKDT